MSRDKTCILSDNCDNCRPGFQSILPKRLPPRAKRVFRRVENFLFVGLVHIYISINGNIREHVPKASFAANDKRINLWQNKSRQVRRELLESLDNADKDHLYIPAALNSTSIASITNIIRCCLNLWNLSPSMRHHINLPSSNTQTK